MVAARSMNATHAHTMAKAPEKALPVTLVTGAPCVTIAIPLGALPAVRVSAAPPALISPDVGAEHVGLTRSALVDVLRAMRADPNFGSRVVVLSRKRAAAAPEDVIRFLRARYTPACAPAEESTDDASAGGVDEVLSLIGAERVPRRAGGTR
jgi:hypothetical protein